MYDIEEIERQWLKYRRRKIVKYSVVLLAGLGIVFGSLSFYLHKKGVEPSKVSPSAQRSASPLHKPMEISRTHPYAVNNNAEMKTVHHSPVTSSKPKERHSNMLIQVTDKKGEAETSGSVPMVDKSMFLKMSDAKSGQVVKQIEARFPDTRDYDDAIYLAKYYYGKHQYSKAENWAMQANTIDSTQEESWIIYAKAKAKQGHRAAALRILQAYYDQTGSLRAKMLIDRIRKGEKF
jgi:tetratricopeptide (TPR) repeat protein